MLLLLISLFSNCHCNEVGQANIKTQLSEQMQKSVRKIDTLLRDIQQEIQIQKLMLRTVDLGDHLKDVHPMKYSSKPAWGEGTPRVDDIGRINPRFPPWMTKSRTDTTQHITTNYTFWENLGLLPRIQLNSSAGPLADVPGELPDQHDYSIDQDFYTFSSGYPTPPPWSPSITLPYNLKVFTTVNSSYFTRPVYPFSGPLETSVAREGSFEDNLPGALDSITRISTLSPSPKLSLPGLRELFTNNPKSSTIFNVFTMSNSKRMKVRTNYAQNKRITKANRITSITHPPRQIERTLSKAQAWVRNRQWMKTSKGGRTKQVLRTSIPALPLIAVTQAELLKEDHEGFLYVSIPASIPETVTSPSTKAGQVLLYARNFTKPHTAVVQSVNQKYHDLMEQWDEGYMMTFLLQLTHMASRGREKEVRAVLYHAEFIMNKFMETAEIAWAGERIVQIAVRVCGFCSETSTFNIDVLQSYAGMFNQMFKERDTALSLEVNSIIEYADLMFDDTEGEELFDAIREFEEYPNTTEPRTSREICLHLMTAFMQPFKRQEKSQRCQRMLRSINEIIEKRFPQRRADGELLMLGGTATTKPTHSREKQGIHNSLKRRISLKRLLINRTKHHDGNEDTYRRQIIRSTEYPLLRSMLPITRRQTRFRVITPRQFRSNAYMNNDRPTKEYKRRLGRPVHPPNEMLQFFPYATKESENNRRMQPTEGKRDNF